MPSIRDNLAAWNRDWGHDGADWSQAWGSSEAMWRASIHSRIGAFLPADTILEIAPGRGRVSQFLLPGCRRYVGIDLSPECVTACRSRFAGEPKARFEVADGASLAMVEDASVDFAFSWDSLVHVDRQVLDAYISELARVLMPGGTAFLHHSNLGAFLDEGGQPTVPNPHWRDPTVSAESVLAACQRQGLHCLVQELVQWGGVARHDCFTLLQRPPIAATTGMPEAIPSTVRLEHPDMNAEMAVTRGLEAAYWRSAATSHDRPTAPKAVDRAAVEPPGRP